jgi:Asp-tRNA(Asn)/Glu-tRNA(Gln) amidotransferase A subunit family amidase
MRMAGLPNPVRSAVASVLRFVGQTRPAAILSVTGTKTEFEHNKYVVRLKAYMAKFVAAMEAGGITALLCPGATLTALPHGASKDLTPACNLNILFNVLHCPAGSVPVCLTQPGEDVYTDSHADLLSGKAAAALTNSVGVPAGVQIATLPFRDELCLKVMADLEAALSGKDLMQPPPWN